LNASSELKTFYVEEDLSQRIDAYLAQQLPYSRAILQKWIKSGRVQINQKIVLKASTEVSEGDEIQLDLPPPPAPSSLRPLNLPLPLLFQDPFLAVINKPSGLLVHRIPHSEQPTLVEALLYHLDSLSDLHPERPGLVHRLDQETSGVLLIAKTNAVHTELARQFEQREVAKQYLAVVRGRIPQDTLELDAPIDRHPKNPTKRCVLPGGKNAYTSFRVLKRYPKHTLLHAFPKTGRTHQIRVHLHHLGFPILGDKVYGKESDPLFQRHALHAQKIKFTHPFTQQEVQFEAPLPEDFQNLLAQLQSTAL
jgi:23S rRNA pseudouridine1911/1915/1917 synthase